MYKLLIALLFKALLMLFVATSAGLELAPDEAHYWTWSHLLDWGYYSKPPGIAWEIWLGTTLFGDTLLGVRFGALVLSILIPIAVFFLAKAAKLSEDASLLAALLAAFTPMGFLVSFYATTDGGLIFFWTIGLLLLTRGVVEGEAPNYPLLGLAIALGALFKWPIYLLWVAALAVSIWVPAFRCSLAIVGLLLSSFGMAPSVIWNAQNGWPTFWHVFGQVAGGGNPGGESNFFDFFAAQGALLSPLFFALLLFSFYFLGKNGEKMGPGPRFLGILTLVLLGGYQGASLFQKIQGNWVVFAYPSAVVFLSWVLLEGVKWGKRWVLPSFALSFAVAGFIFVLPVLQGAEILNVPLKYSHLKECLGWGCIGEKLLEVGYNPEEDFLLSDSYQMASLLHFYAPEQKRVYFLNLWNRRKNQYAYWPQLADEKMGKSGIFATSETFPHKTKSDEELAASLQEALTPYFSSVQLLAISPIVFVGGDVAKALFLFRVEGYNGEVPAESNRY